MVKKTYRQAIELAIDIKNIIDEYWAKKISKTDAKKEIRSIVDVDDNRKKVYRGDEYLVVFTNKLGKRRLAAFEELVAD